MSAHVSNNSGKEEWYTPEHIMDLVWSVFGRFPDLDPASCEKANEIVKAKQFYTKEQDGLALPWHGDVFLNPPYSAGMMRKFIAKATWSYNRSEIKSAIILTNNASETVWGQQLLRRSRAVCFPQSRIKFLNENLQPANTPLQGQMICYLGAESMKFNKIFKDLGCVMIEGYYR
jgi:phage N-6-adenine-methyltransferase